MSNFDDFIDTYVRELLIITAMHDEILDNVKMGRPIPGTFKFQHATKKPAEPTHRSGCWECWNLIMCGNPPVVCLQKAGVVDPNGRHFGWGDRPLPIGIV